MGAFLHFRNNRHSGMKQLYPPLEMRLWNRFARSSASLDEYKPGCRSSAGVRLNFDVVILGTAIEEEIGVKQCHVGALISVSKTEKRYAADV